jgi:hypothetical protein
VLLEGHAELVQTDGRLCVPQRMPLSAVAPRSPPRPLPARAGSGR